MIFCLAILFKIDKVHAISFDPYTWNNKQINGSDYAAISKNGTLTFDLDLTYSGEINDEITNKYGLLNAWNGSSGSNGTTYNFLISTCALGGSLTGFANKYNSLLKTVDSGLTCSVSSYTGTVIYYFVKLTPNVYNVGNSTTYYVNWNSTLTFTNSYNYAVFFRISSIDILTDEEMTSLINDYTNINALNNQISKIQETNDKLDEQISQNNTIINQNQDIIDNQEQTNEKLDEQTQQDKEQHDELMNSDISEEDKELPDDSKYQDYTSTEDSLKDKVNQADLSVVSIGIDANSSNWVWNTLTNLIQSNAVIFGMFIAILSIGIIKLALGR